MNRFTVALIGNPNCGKTTVFNALTGAKQRVGNWPGVTVERKTGQFQYQDITIEVIDLPGTYSTIIVGENAAIDESITCQFLLSGKVDAIINIVDASNLERNLYLTTQLLEMPVPLLTTVNMMDVAKQRGFVLDLALLEKNLACPVSAIAASKGEGIVQLKAAIVQLCTTKMSTHQGIPLPAIIESAITALVPELERIGVPAANHRYFALSLLENDKYVESATANQLKTIITAQQNTIIAQEDEPDLLIADARYGFVHTLAHKVTDKTSKQGVSHTEWLDSIVLNRFLGIPIFLTIMYLMFAFAINIGGIFQNCFDILSDTFFVQGAAHLLTYWGMPGWLTAIIANGVGKGINTTITFIPVIGAMFLFLAFLEDSGYMARAAFVMDRFMRALGLPGKAFVPMIIGFGCNVPAVMAARTLESRRDRILTVIMSPFMSCGARLAIFAVFTSIFFPVGGQNIVFALYLIGIGIAFLTGLLLRKSFLQGKPAPFIIELPPYHLPTGRTLVLQAWQRLKSFIVKAGKIIVPVCMLLGILSAVTTQGVLVEQGASQSSLIAVIGQWLTPIFAPMGLHTENWPATVALITGTLAKEVVIGTLNTLYAQVGNLGALTNDNFNLAQGLSSAFAAIGEGFRHLPQALHNPILAGAKEQVLTTGVNGMMFRFFDGQVGAFAYLLFTLLYIPCISTTAAVARELNKSWAWFSVLWGAGVAYGAAVVFYQIATWSRHPEVSALWLMGITVVFGLIIWSMRRYALAMAINESPALSLQNPV